MYYYDTDNRAPRRWAALATAIYVVVLAALLFAVSFERPAEIPQVVDTMYIDLTELRPEAAEEPRRHEVEAPVEQTAPAAAEEVAEEVRTPNPRAMFKMSKSSDEVTEQSANPEARQGAASTAPAGGTGVSPEGTQQLDNGLQGRGLKGSLPKPAYPGTSSGKIVIRVTVDAAGTVTSAAYEPVGSTSSDGALVEAAIAAARKARFTESSAAVQGGTITYIFRME